MRNNILFLAFMFIIILTMIGCSNDNVPNKNLEESSEDGLIAPPNLTIHIGNETVTPRLGTYSWSNDNKDGTATSVESDSPSPPELVKENQPLQVTAEATIKLDFEKEPDRYTLRIWDEDHNVVNATDKIVLSDKGLVIYEVLAYWEEGTASYAFSLMIE